MAGFEGNLVPDVGFTCGTVEGPDGKPVEVVGLVIPSDIPEVYHEYFMTLATTQKLIADLQEAVDHCLRHARQEKDDG